MNEQGELPGDEQEAFRAFARRTAEADSRRDVAAVIVEVVDGLLDAPGD